MVALRKEPVVANKRQRPRLPPETREEQQKRQQLRRRMRDLDLPIQRAAGYVGVSDKMLYALLCGRVRVSRVLGYDQWQTRFSEFLDRYEISRAKTQQWAQELVEQLNEDNLPLIYELQACLPGKRGRRGRP